MQWNEVEIMQIAKTAHNVNKAFCESIGDNSQPDWDNAPDWQRKSAESGVRYHLENEDTGPEDSHNEWLKVKEKDGWIYGEAKDEKKKTHPCMVPYDELPAEQQTKDMLFCAVVHSYRE